MKEKQLLMEAHLKDTQLKYLQSQINPHFLFNTLNACAQLAMLEGADRTYTYVQNVADFYRYNVRKKRRCCDSCRGDRPGEQLYLYYQRPFLR